VTDYANGGTLPPATSVLTVLTVGTCVFSEADIRRLLIEHDGIDR
jgi:hypothetical protein